MELTLENLKAEVMRLSAADRSRLLDALLDSIDQDDAIEREWEQLADRRDAELDSGMVEAIDGAVVLARLQSKYPG
jgi:Putative addiction module component